MEPDTLDGKNIEHSKLIRDSSKIYVRFIVPCHAEPGFILFFENTVDPKLNSHSFPFCLHIHVHSYNWNAVG